MTAMSGTRFCMHCDEPIGGVPERVEAPAGDSGARPDGWRHPECGPAQAPYVRRSPYSQ
ncbi:hypothetical protein [Streptomyces ficellus]|uniref:hypothetical protein n=1 Tax=Streptomyces ficellus TaxID=1977088 RepID=UPI001FCB127E|nr:hypothetical protein [Streptomyces ficellus]